VALVATPPPGRLVRTDGGDLAAADETGPGVWTFDALTQAARDRGIEIARSQVRRIPARRVGAVASASFSSFLGNE
jgi:hypothetical protein